MKRNDKRILFIAWDSPMVTYLEGLFIPIFEKLSAIYGYEFHIIQFSWASQERIKQLSEFCKNKGLRYTQYPVTLKPFAALGKYLTTFYGINFINEYVRRNSIGIVMPRSTMPARMTLAVLKKNPELLVIFDADGLPIDERVDFAGLKPGGFRFNQLKKIEKNIIARAAVVLTRTASAADYLSSQYQITRSKFFQVTNGRDDQKFKPQLSERNAIRRKLNIPADSLVLVYCGSMGPQYGVEQMLYIHRRLTIQWPDTYLMVMTNNPSYVLEKTTESMRRNTVVMSVGFEQIGGYLAAADVAFAIRKDAFSMAGVAPIKLGEYLLMGLPVIASSHIGDSDQLLSGQSFAFLLKDYSEVNLDLAVKWIVDMRRNESNVRVSARAFALEHFTLERSAESYHVAIKSVL